MPHDPSLLQSVYDAAEGSYSAIYHDSACDDVTLQPVLARFNAWLADVASFSLEPAEAERGSDAAAN